MFSKISNLQSQPNDTQYMRANGDCLTYIAEMRREIKQEIDRIDNSYARFDLLRIIFASAKVSANLWQEAKSRQELEGGK